MKDNLDNGALERARWILRSKQREYTVAASPTATLASVTDVSLGFLDRMTGFRPTADAGRVKRGPWTFDRDLEVERIACARTLIRRTAPGLLEDPNYLALLAYQAASIQIAHENMLADSKSRDRFSRYVLGTVFRPELNAFATKVPIEGYSIIVLHSGLIDFVYQAAKAVIEALNPSRSTTGRSAVAAALDLKLIRERMRSEPGALVRLYRVLAAYFFDGYPRASSFETVLDEQSPPLSLLVSMAERWILGHEY